MKLKSADFAEVLGDLELALVVAIRVTAVHIAKPLLAILEIKAPHHPAQKVTQVVEGHEGVGALEVVLGYGEEVGLQALVDRREHMPNGSMLLDAQLLLNLLAQLVPILPLWHNDVHVAKVGFVALEAGNTVLT